MPVSPEPTATASSPWTSVQRSSRCRKTAEINREPLTLIRHHPGGCQLPDHPSAADLVPRDPLPTHSPERVPRSDWKKSSTLKTPPAGTHCSVWWCVERWCGGYVRRQCADGATGYAGWYTGVLLPCACCGVSACRYFSRRSSCHLYHTHRHRCCLRQYQVQLTFNPTLIVIGGIVLLVVAV